MVGARACTCATATGRAADGRVLRSSGRGGCPFPVVDVARHGQHRRGPPGGCAHCLQLLGLRVPVLLRVAVCSRGTRHAVHRLLGRRAHVLSAAGTSLPQQRSTHDGAHDCPSDALRRLVLRGIVAVCAGTTSLFAPGRPRYVLQRRGAVRCACCTVFRTRTRRQSTNWRQA